MYNKLSNSIGGTDTLDFLYQKLSTFIFNGKQKLKLKILKISSFEKKLLKNHITSYYLKSKKVQTVIDSKSEPSIKNK